MPSGVRDEPPVTIRECEGGLEIAIHAQPRASRSEVVSLHGDSLKVRLAAPPVEGAANAELIRVVAKVLGVPKTLVDVIRRRSGRSKVVRVAGLTVEDARARLGL